MLVCGGEAIVGEASTIYMAMESTSLPEIEIDSLGSGGFHAPNVMVFRDHDGQHVRPFRVDMVYAAPFGVASSTWRCLRQMEVYRQSMKATRFQHYI